MINCAIENWEPKAMSLEGRIVDSLLDMVYRKKVTYKESTLSQGSTRGYELDTEDMSLQGRVVDILLNLIRRRYL